MLLSFVHFVCVFFFFLLVFLVGVLGFRVQGLATSSPCALCHATTSSYGNAPPKQSNALPTVTSTLPRPAPRTSSKSGMERAPPAYVTGMGECSSG